jgi:FkbM family methyltransferase
MISVSRFWKNNPLLKREKCLRFLEDLFMHASGLLLGNSKRSGEWETLTSRGIDTVLVDFHRERYKVFAKDQVISRELYIRGQFDLKKLQRAHAHLFRVNRVLGQTLVDVGANLGSICIPAVARGYFKTAIAIEANLRTAEALRQNVLLNKLEPYITVYEIAAGKPNQGPVSIVEDGLNLGASRVVDSRESGDSAEVRELDDLVGRLDEIGLVFMDVEGYEGNVLFGARLILATRVPIALEFSPNLLVAHISKEEFCSLFSEYSGCYSLNDPFSKFWPIHRLGQLWDWYINEPDSEQTDLLFV